MCQMLQAEDDVVALMARQIWFKDTSVHREGRGMREGDALLLTAFVCTFIS